MMPNVHSASPKGLSEVLGSETGGDGIVHDAEHTIGIMKGGGGCGDSKNGRQGVYVALNICSASGRGVEDVGSGEVGRDTMNMVPNGRSALCRGWGTWWVCRRHRRPRPSSLSWAMMWHVERGGAQGLGVPGLTFGHAVEH